MKTVPSKASSLRGNTLFIVLIITGLVGFVLAAYLTLLRSQNTATMRSQAWNASVPVLEAGIEDALTHLNTHGTTNLACDGWVQSGTIYYMQRWLGGNYYFVTISNFIVGSTNNAPMVESRGYVSVPALTASAEQPFLAQVAGSPNSTTNFLGRGVRCTTKQQWIFAKGMVAKGQIDLAGNNIATDSFDSSDPAYNTGGLYDASKHKAGGDIATNSGLTNSINVGNADVWGHVSTGPGGSISIGPLGSVGDLAWHVDNKKGVETGWTTDDMNVDFADVKPPFTAGFPPGGGNVGGTNYDYVLGSLNYMKFGAVSLDGSQTILVTGNAVLYVTGNFSLNGNASISIASGASLKLYVGTMTGSAVTVSLGGNGVINNAGNAMNFMYYGLPSNKILSVGGNSSFIGTIYAPSADFTLNGGGGSTYYDFTGASVTQTVKFNGHFNFHYDEALGKYGPPRGYIVTSWNELTPQEVATWPTLGLTGGPTPPNYHF